MDKSKSVNSGHTTPDSVETEPELGISSKDNTPSSTPSSVPSAHVALDSATKPRTFTPLVTPGEDRSEAHAAEQSHGISAGGHSGTGPHGSKVYMKRHPGPSAVAIRAPSPVKEKETEDDGPGAARQFVPKKDGNRDGKVQDWRSSILTHVEGYGGQQGQGPAESASQNSSPRPVKTESSASPSYFPPAGDFFPVMHATEGSAEASARNGGSTLFLGKPGEGSISSSLHVSPSRSVSDSPERGAESAAPANGGIAIGVGVGGPGDQSGDWMLTSQGHLVDTSGMRYELADEIIQLQNAANERAAAMYQAGLPIDGNLPDPDRPPMRRNQNLSDPDPGRSQASDLHPSFQSRDFASWQTGQQLQNVLPYQPVQVQGIVNPSAPSFAPSGGQTRRRSATSSGGSASGSSSGSNLAAAGIAQQQQQGVARAVATQGVMSSSSSSTSISLMSPPHPGGQSGQLPIDIAQVQAQSTQPHGVQFAPDPRPDLVSRRSSVGSHGSSKGSSNKQASVPTSIPQSRAETQPPGYAYPSYDPYLLAALQLQQDALNYNHALAQAQARLLPELNPLVAYPPPLTPHPYYAAVAPNPALARAIDPAVAYSAAAENLLALRLGQLALDLNMRNGVRVTAAGPSVTNRKLDLYKTELCRSFEEKGQCKYKEKCQFAHGHHELRQVPRHPKYKTEVCKTFWLHGSCPYGTRCCFIHTTVPGGAQAAGGGEPPASVPMQHERSNSDQPPEPVSRLAQRTSNASSPGNPNGGQAVAGHARPGFGPSLSSYLTPQPSGLPGSVGPSPAPPSAYNESFSPSGVFPPPMMAIEQHGFSNLTDATRGSRFTAQETFPKSEGRRPRLDRGRGESSSSVSTWTSGSLEGVRSPPIQSPQHVRAVDYVSARRESMEQDFNRLQNQYGSANSRESADQRSMWSAQQGNATPGQGRSNGSPLVPVHSTWLGSQDAEHNSGKRK